MSIRILKSLKIHKIVFISVQHSSMLHVNKELRYYFLLVKSALCHPWEHEVEWTLDDGEVSIRHGRLGELGQLETEKVKLVAKKLRTDGPHEKHVAKIPQLAQHKPEMSKKIYGHSEEVTLSDAANI